MSNAAEEVMEAKSWALTPGSGEVISDLDQNSMRGRRHLSHFIWKMGTICLPTSEFCNADLRTPRASQRAPPVGTICFYL